MQIPIDVEVQCTDGPAGHTAAIIVDPATKQVTHVVVKGKGTLLGEFLVPVDHDRPGDTACRDPALEPREAGRGGSL